MCHIPTILPLALWADIITASILDVRKLRLRKAKGSEQPPLSSPHLAEIQTKFSGLQIQCCGFPLRIGITYSTLGPHRNQPSLTYTWVSKNVCYIETTTPMRRNEIVNWKHKTGMATVNQSRCVILSPSSAPCLPWSALFQDSSAKDTSIQRAPTYHFLMPWGQTKSTQYIYQGLLKQETW